MKCFVPWGGAEISEKVKKVLWKIFFAISILLVGFEMIPFVSYLFVKYSILLSGIWQRILFMLPRWR